VDKFLEVYEALSNSAESSREMTDIKVQLAELIRVVSVNEVMKITGAKVKEAVGLMNDGKSDVTDGFTSDAILNAPDLFFDHLASIYRSCLIHGSVTPILLACAFLPLLRNSLKDPADTGSYRAITGSSLLLKQVQQE
jgi:hypothetical protein